MSNDTGAHPASSHSSPPESAVRIDVSEHGATRDGVSQEMDRRLFMQLLVLDVDGGTGVDAAIDRVHGELVERKHPHVLYHDVNAPRGFGVLTFAEDPSEFVTVVRPVLESPALAARPRHDVAMLGRTYSTGYEQDLAFWLLDRPRQTVLNPSWPWAVWYPLRRTGAFARLEPREQGGILREHGTIGRAYGTQDLAHDIRLACHGLDAKDNEFVIGLIGKALHPLSHVVQSMRKTRQTSEFMQQMGPFFVGHVARQFAGTTPDTR